MGLEITITHLTRMGGDRICVAGLTDDAEFVRPDCAGHLRRADVPDLFRLGARVDLGEVARRPSRPQVENVRFDRSSARQLRRATRDELLALLPTSAQRDLDDIFGSDLKQSKAGSCYVDRNAGSGSLGTLRIPPGQLDVRQDSYGNLRGWWRDPRRGDISPRVTDLRMYPVAGGSHDGSAVRRILTASRNCGELYLSVGLTSFFSEKPGHWLQLNNVLPIRAS